MWILAAIFAVYVFVDQKILKDYYARNPLVATIDNLPTVGEIKKEVVAPLPLRATTTSSTARIQITTTQLVAFTNKERQKFGLLALGDNFILDSAALAKTKDMFTKQYFDHISPSGESVSNFVTKEGYDYFIIGENLASGGFKNTEAIINAWMASPGHRDNILNPKYREMGAVALSGKFEGKNILFAVQIFGTPSSICSKPDDAIKLKIEDITKIIDTKKQILDVMRQEINYSNIDYMNNVKINEYNVLVREYNNLVDQAKNLITAYNDQVRQFSECETAAAR